VINVGPFGREGIEYKHIKGIYTGRMLVEESGCRMMQALAACGVLSSRQMLALSGAGRYSRKVLPRLVEKGYLDCYESSSAPRLYSLSEKSAELFGVPYRVWDTSELLRLAAANQFWLQAREIWPGSNWNALGEVPVMVRSGVKYVVLSPRAGQFEKVLAVRHLNRARERVFVVAPDEETALEIAVSCPPGRLVRYTWDDELKDKFALYRFDGRMFVVDTVAASPKIFLEKSIENC